MLLFPIDMTRVTLGGEFGRRVNAIIENNILKTDVEKKFLTHFRRESDATTEFGGAYSGFGKFIDAVAHLAAATRDARLLALKQELVKALLATQTLDGYMGTIKDPKMRVERLWDLHEGAYLIWALVSDHRLFGESASLNAARRLADFFIARFAFNPGLRVDQPYDVTFEVADIGFDRALLALSEVSGEARYRDFVAQVLKLPEYDPPIRCGTTTFANHAYGYLSHCVAQLDLYRQKPDPALLHTSHKLLDFLRQGDGMLVTGSASLWECWHDTQSGQDNLSETCVGAYLARFMEAMLQIEGESFYGDILERDIYNALFAVTAPDGSQSRYFTPFDGKRHYDPHEYPCCDNNNRRFLADLRGWLYYRTAQGVAVNLYSASTVTIDFASDVTLRLEQQTDYPTSGKVTLKVDPSKAAHFEVKLRIPRWCKDATVVVNGSTTTVSGGQFYGLTRQWQAGDVIDLDMPMTWRFIRGRKAQAGRAAILRGPVIFAFNPTHNAELAGQTGFDARLLKINPLEIEPPLPDESIRPEGLSCRVRAWSPHQQPWPMVERSPLVLTEYPDPGGQAIYFIVPGEGVSQLTDDELVGTQAPDMRGAV